MVYLFWRRRLLTPPTSRRPSRPFWQVGTVSVPPPISQGEGGPPPVKWFTVQQLFVLQVVLWSALRAACYMSVITERGKSCWVNVCCRAEIRTDSHSDTGLSLLHNVVWVSYCWGVTNLCYHEWDANMMLFSVSKQRLHLVKLIKILIDSKTKVNLVTFKG